MSCYLVFDVASLGTLFSIWSDEPVEGAWAVIKPSKPVPRFKFTQKGGKSEIIRKIREDRRRLFQGWAEFIKSAKTYDGTFELLEPREVTVTFSHMGEVFPIGTKEPVEVSKFSAVAVCGKDKDPFQNVKSMSNAQFLDIGLSGKGFSMSL